MSDKKFVICTLSFILAVIATLVVFLTVFAEYTCGDSRVDYGVSEEDLSDMICKEMVFTGNGVFKDVDLEQSIITYKIPSDFVKRLVYMCIGTDILSVSYCSSYDLDGLMHAVNAYNSGKSNEDKVKYSVVVNAVEDIISGKSDGGIDLSQFEGVN